MIDDKKIEEAAQGAADLYEQDLPIMSHNEDTEVDGQHHFCQEFGAELFKDGANWAINEFLKDLWHPASEEPRKGAKFLYQNHYNSRFYYYIDKIDDILETYPNWSSYVKHVRVIQWLYIEDLFPKEGGEQ